MIDLHESEYVASQKLLEHLQQKYGHKRLTDAVFISVSKEAKELFAEIGLQVEVYPVEPLTIDIVDRLDSFDIERQEHELRKGVADEFWDKAREVQRKKHGK